MSLLRSMLPYAIAAMAAAPIVLVITAVIVSKAKRPGPAAFAFVMGAVFLDVVFAIVILALMEAAGIDSSSGEVAGIVDTVLGAAFVILGASALFSKPSPEKEAAQKMRVEGFATSSFGSLFRVGVAVQLINADALVVFAAGLKEIPLADPQPSTVDVVVVLIIFLFIMLIPYHLPLDLHLIAPERTREPLHRMTEWLLAHTRPIEIVVGFGIGGVFLIKGLTALLG
jgi:threonine/homoserine/homoserine lactone efflux protein